MSSAAAQQSISTKLVRSILARLRQLAGRSAFAIGIAGNHIEQSNVPGAVVAAGGAIVPTTSLTTIGPSGKVRVHYFLTFTFTPGVVNILLSIGHHGFALPIIHHPAQMAASPQTISGSVDVTTALPAGSVIDVTLTTSPGDAAITLQTAGASVGADVITQEIF
jgi:hypothetical protein